MTIEITLPPLTSPQIAIRDSKARFKVVAAGRRFGKSRVACALCVEELINRPGSHTWWVAPVYSQADGAWADLKTFASAIPGCVVRESDRQVRYAGGYVQIKTASDPDTLRGSGLDFVVLDEAAFMPGSVWFNAIRPALSDRKGRALVISSPNGSGNWFHILWLSGKAGDPEIDSFHYPTSANPFIDPKEIEAARHSQPAITFSQEYLAEFTDDSGRVFRGIKDCLYYGRETPHPAERRYLSMGADFGQMADFTVLTVVDSSTGRMVDIDRFNQIAWSIQRDHIQALYEKWKPSVIWAESNSIGSVNIEELHKARLPIQAFTTTNQSKAEIVQALAYGIETGKLKLPADHPHSEVLLAELEAFQAERLPSGRWRYAAPSNLHDDCVMSLALCWWGARNVGTSFTKTPAHGLYKRRARFADGDLRNRVD